ncbi:MAG TPA: hypothetical protein VND65_05395 [Candidatus Binatia bacterium]|nr:hypothetical protein [Candidatus Binatia bacterium]
MNAPLAALPTTELTGANAASEIKKKRVLLVDASNPKRDLRAGAMRKLGMEVDCAADITEARCWWKADLYDLVLVNVEKGRGNRDNFCEEVRKATPPQRLAFLVGKPEYIADSPGADEVVVIADYGQHSVAGDIRAALSADMGNSTQRWGIMEASRRISAVRLACNARTRAMQNLPAPRRDAESRETKRVSATLDDLLREEMQ